MDVRLEHQRAVEVHSQFISSSQEFLEPQSANSFVEQATEPPGERSLRAQLHALALSNAALVERLRGAGLQQLVEEDLRELALKPEVRARLALTPQARSRVLQAWSRSPHAQAHNRIDAAWVERVLDALADRLDQALAAWRGLYRAARSQLEQATQRLDGGLLRPSTPAWQQAQRSRDDALRQLALLRNEQPTGARGCDFEPQHYLATEGFLPGPAPALQPLRLLLTAAGGCEFVVLPRDAAGPLGPLALLRHAGRSYRITGLLAREGEVRLTEATLVRRSGCLLLEAQRQRELCPLSGAGLADAAARERLHDLLEVTACRAEEVVPAPSGPEPGLAVMTCLGIGDGDLARSSAASLQCGPDTLMRLRFVSEARVVQLHRGWLDAPEGFALDLRGGHWLAAPTCDSRPLRRVRLWAWQRADALHLQPGPALRLDREAAAALLQALCTALQRALRLAPGMVQAHAIGEGDAPGLLLHTAPGERGAALARLVHRPRAFNAVAARALALCPAETPAARDALALLATSTLRRPVMAHEATYETVCEQFLAQLEPGSGAARRFIEFLRERGLRLPDAVRRRVPGLYLRPDFHYAPHTWVFCDDAVLKEAVAAQRDLLWSRGDEVFSWHAGEDLAKKVAERPDLFGLPR